MSFETAITIAEAIHNIEENRYLLPSIQREFVWKNDKIEWLFDSIMRNYPISSFLFWRVEGKTKQEFKFYKFINEYRQRYKTHNEEFNTVGHNDFTAVLDGQQRLTSLYIGLRGSYAYRMARLREEDSERVYPTRRLYLNINNPLENEEDGRIYEFKFLTDDEYSKNVKKWFRVSEIYGLTSFSKFTRYLDEHNLMENDFSIDGLSRLQEAVHSDRIINFFLEKDQVIDKALNIFIRINSGGEPLDFSDLIMSIAVANWEEKDARKEIYSLVDSIRNKGFTIRKDFILKTFLYLHSSDIKFKVTNFSNSNAKDFEQKWNSIRDAILSTFDFVRSLGFSDYTLTSKNALIPIVYYLYHRGIYEGFSSKTAYSEDRKVINKWLHVSLAKRLFGGQSDSILNQIRRAYTNNVSDVPLSSGLKEFPAQQINKEIRKDTSVSDEFIEELLMTQKDHQYAFSLLALLFPHLDYKNNNFHKDHLHPIAKFDAAFGEAPDANEKRFTYNSLKNLQMLDENENMSKSDKDLSLWVAEQTKQKDRKSFLKNHYIPDVDLSLENFDEFIAKRSELLASKLKDILA